MDIGIIGAGNVGSALARLLADAGHTIRIAAASPHSSRLAEVAVGGVQAASPVEVAAASDIVVLAVPFTALDEALPADVADRLAGSIVVDATNPLASDYMSLTIGHTTSAGEQVAARLPRSTVVKAFNTIFAANYATPVLGGVRQFLPVAGDDEDAKKTVLRLGEELGFDAVDAGPLSNARYLEPAVELLIQLAYGRGLGTGIGFALARAG